MGDKSEGCAAVMPVDYQWWTRPDMPRTDQVVEMVKDLHAHVDLVTAQLARLQDRVDGLLDKIDRLESRGTMARRRTDSPERRPRSPTLPIPK